FRRDLEVVVVRLSLPKDRKSQSAAPPGLVFDDFRPAVGKDLAVFGRDFLRVLVVQVGRDQSNDVIEPHSVLLVDFNPGSSEPGARIRRVPRGRSMSSKTMQRSSGPMPFFSQRARTASPEAFMKVCGSARTTLFPETWPRPTRDWPSRERIRTPSSSASLS